jgi:DNA recombination protein RmuC
MTEQTLTALLLILAAGAALAVGWRLGRQRTQAELQTTAAQQETERATWLAERAGLAGDIARLQGELVAESRAHEEARSERDRQREQNGELEKAMQPLRTAMQELTTSLGDSERARVRAQTELREQVTGMSRQFGEATADVRTEARRLSQVLSRNEKRGAWGEMQLRQLVESSGMINHVHFVEQDHTTDDDVIQRPDMVIDLAGGRRAVVDSKVPLDAFLRMELSADPSEALEAHAAGVAAHIQKLSAKEYWRRYDSPEFVIMFLPAEGLLSAALETRPELLQLALDRKIVLATPTTLLAILHAITHAWRQAEAAEHARHIQELGVEFYRRILKMADTINSLGQAIGRTVKAYDATVSTIETRVFPAARRMEGLSIADSPVPELVELDVTTRPLSHAKWEPGAEVLPAGRSPEPIVDPQASGKPAPDATGDSKLRSA